MAAQQIVNIVIGGPAGAGKTTFVETLKAPEPFTDAVNETDLPEPSVIDFGRMDLDEDVKIQLYGLPAERKYRDHWQILLAASIGYIMLVDSTRPETFASVRAMLKIFAEHNPGLYVIGANKPEHPGAKSPDEIRKALHLPASIPVLPCDVTRKDSAESVLLQLLYSVLDDIEDSSE